MNPDDARHGTTRGFHAGCRQTCCRKAMCRYEKSVKARRYRGETWQIPAVGVQRRIRALMRLGWTSTDIADACGWGHRNSVRRILEGQKGKPCTWVERKTYHTIAAVYERLAMTIPPHAPHRARTRTLAVRRGYAPPLAYDDIDNDPSPVGDGCTHTGCGLKVVRKGLCDKHLRAAPRTGQAWANDVDPIVVDRLLDGERVVSTRAEKDEALRRWLAAGRSERSFCQLHDLKEGRYGKGAAA